MAANLTIPIATVAFIIQLARQFEVKVAPYDDNEDAELSDEDEADLLEARRSDPIYDELVEVIDDLNDDEALDLVALMWIGRGTYSPDQWDEARETARVEATHSTADYLLGTPLLSDFLEEGLSEMGQGSVEIEAR